MNLQHLLILMSWTSAKKHFNCLLLLCYFITLFFTICISLIYTVNGFYVFLVIRKCATCKIVVVPEECWFGQPKYSTPSKKTFYVVSVFCRKLNSERLTVRLELTVSYVVFHFQGTAWLLQEMFTITTEKRRYNWNNQDESLYSITTKSRPLKKTNK